MISRNDTIEAPIAKLNQPPILAEIIGIEIVMILSLQKGKAMKSSPLVGPFGDSEFWEFSLLKI